MNCNEYGKASTHSSILAQHVSTWVEYEISLKRILSLNQPKEVHRGEKPYDK